MRFLAEDRIANEIAEMIKRDFDYNDRRGYRPFSYEFDFDQDEFIAIEGSLDYTVTYEEDVNYAFISFASVDIDSIKVFNNDGEEVKCKYNIAKIEEYIKNYLTEQCHE